MFEESFLHLGDIHDRKRPMPLLMPMELQKDNILMLVFDNFITRNKNSLSAKKMDNSPINNCSNE